MGVKDAFGPTCGAAGIDYESTMAAIIVVGRCCGVLALYAMVNCAFQVVRCIQSMSTNIFFVIDVNVNNMDGIVGAATNSIVVAAGDEALHPFVIQICGQDGAAGAVVDDVFQFSIRV